MEPIIGENKSCNVKFKRIGNGGAFNWKMTNSSFLINCIVQEETTIPNTAPTTKESYLLFDCGYSVFPKLMELDEAGEIDINNLTSIFISHMDGDHIGSLKILIQYMYYMKNKVLRILCGEKLFDELYNHLYEINATVENFTSIRNQICNIESIEHKEWFLNNGVVFQPFEVEHYQPAYGLKTYDPNQQYNLIISGDTIPTRNILNVINSNEVYDNHAWTASVVFHDYSTWDCPEKQVHSCDKALNNTYPKEVIENLNKYHNNESFLSGWVKLDKDIISSYKVITN